MLFEVFNARWCVLSMPVCTAEDPPGCGSIAVVAWEDDVFAVLEDLEGQATAAFADERDAELADRSRAEYSAVTLTGRLMASAGQQVEIDVRGVGRVRGTLARVARTWCLVGGHSQEWFLPRQAIVAVAGASPRAVPDVAWTPLSALGLGSALRRIADAQERCLVHTLDGERFDVVIRRVGADFVEAVTGEERVLLLVLDTVAAVQRRG